MSEQPSPSVHRQEVDALCKDAGISPTPQAAAALTNALDASHFELIGDSDSLLAGLMLSGSYTVDVLEHAGADPRYLKALAVTSARSSPVSEREENPSRRFQTISPLLYGQLESSGVLDEVMRAGGKLDAAHILRAALRSSGSFDDFDFPWHLRQDAASEDRLAHQVDRAIVEILSFSASLLIATPKRRREAHLKWLAPILEINEEQSLTLRILTERRHRVAAAEDAILDKLLASYYHDMETDELEFIIEALNAWFAKRIVLSEPSAVAKKVVTRMRSLLFAPRMFVEAGGSFSEVDKGLDLARRFAPERDDCYMVLSADEGGRLSIGEYTYRNSLATVEKVTAGTLVQGLSISALRPVPLVASGALEQLRQLLAGNPSEPDIQRLLNQHPEIIASLGYTTAIPHILLKQDGEDRMVPDYITTLPAGYGFDILDLKLPTASPVVAGRYARASAELSKAVAQLTRYGKFFDDADNRREFERRYGLRAFRPKLVVVMGRDRHFRSLEDRRHVEDQTPGVRLVTYDELLAYGSSRTIVRPH